MSYLISSDYQKQIQADNLNQITTSIPAVRTTAELAAQAECISYLIQKYDAVKEFTDTLIYDSAAIYKAAARVYVDALVYNAALAYAAGAMVLQAGNIYACIVPIDVPEPFTAAHWQLLGAEYDLFYALYPFPVFDLTGVYALGDTIWWNDHTYTALIPTIPIDHDDLIQFGRSTNVPYQNVFPDDRAQGKNFWTDNGVYTVPAGSLANPAFFIKGDNRNPQMVMYMIDITLYHLHSRIAPRNIPQLRIDRYDAAISWLKMAMKGSITAALPTKQPPQGARIRAGSNIKNINSY